VLRRRLLPCFALLFVVSVAGCSGRMTTPAVVDGPARTAYAPPSGKGPIVVLLSGHSGPGHYQPIAGAVANLGYDAVLLDGQDILAREQDGRGNLRKAALIAERFQVPVLIRAGHRDTYHDCCLVDSMRAIERSARERSKT
jgi:hypothetical protein